jgi:hypothetical protein
MKKLIIIMLVFISITSFGQENRKQFERKGFIFGAGIGGGFVSIATGDSENLLDQTEIGLSLPNLKLGWMLNEKMAVMIHLPGMIYELNDNDRSFQSILPSFQYWFTDNCWINAGAGLAIDLPALYDIDDIENEKWYFGGAVAFSAGHEIYQRGKFAIDLHSCLQLGRVNLDNDSKRDGISFMFGLGFNWY